MNKLFSLIRFSILEHIENDLYKLPGKSIHGLPVCFPLFPFPPIISMGFWVIDIKPVQ